MHITILAHGTRGDVQPYVALGLGLEQAGHRVRLAAPDMFRALVDAYGLEFWPLAGDPTVLMRDAVEQAGGRPNLLRLAPVVLRYATAMALEVVEDGRRACRGAEAIVHSFLTTTLGHELALEMGVPDVSALLFLAFTPTAAFPNGAFPELPLGGWYNRLTHELFTQVYWQGGRSAYRWITRGRPEGRLPLTRWPWTASGGRVPPILYGLSPTVVPRPADWPEHAHVTGFWHLPAREPGPPALEQFLAAGDPPVAISFGSVIARDAERLTALALEALARTGQRGVLVAGWGGLARTDLPGDVFMLDSVPFDWLFARAAAAVIHGGIGTTAAAMRAGVPAVVVPFTADQTSWGEQVARLGVGPRPVPYRRLTADRLARAIEAAVGDGGMRRQAERLGEALRAEDGVGAAVRIIENHVR